MRLTAGALLYRWKKGTLEVLLVRADGDKMWSIPKGKVGFGERLKDAARREMKEECGIKTRQLEPFAFVNYPGGKKRLHCFLGPAPEGQEPHPQAEIRFAKFMSVDKAIRRIDRVQRALLSCLIEDLSAA